LSTTESIARILTREPDDRIDVVKALINAPVRRFDDLAGLGPGVYALLFRGDLKCYERLRRPVDDDGSIVESGGFPIYVGSAKRLEVRAREHRRKLAATTDLDPAEFGLIQLSTASAAAALYGEALLIDSFRPCWNQRWIAGAGSKSRGKLRSCGSRSPWSLFHQEQSQGNDADFAAMQKISMAARISAHLASTVSSAAANGIRQRPLLHLVV
jgi:hypothetical protein